MVQFSVAKLWPGSLLVFRTSLALVCTVFIGSVYWQRVCNGSV